MLFYIVTISVDKNIITWKNKLVVVVFVCLKALT